MVRPKKHLGQHFLTDLSVAARTADLALDFPDLPWIEIGPGTGVLSRELLSRKVPFKAVEIDTESVHYLHINHPEMDVLEGDFLQLDLSELYSDAFGVIGNFPYNISSQIVFKILDHLDRVPVFAGMFQLEVARRLESGPNTKLYGITSVLTQAWYDVKVCFKIPPGAFNPPPKVQSAVILATRHHRPFNTDALLFRDVVKTAFQQRRKTLRNALSKFNPDGFPPEHAHLLKLRAENLTVEQFIELTEVIRARKS